MANQTASPTHDQLLDILRADIAAHDDLEGRRAAVDTYSLLVHTVIQDDQAYEDAPEPLFSEPEINRLYIVECGQ